MLELNLAELRAQGFLVTERTAEQLLTRIANAEQVVVDTETSGLRAWQGSKLCGVGVALSGSEGYYWPFRHPKDNLERQWLPRLWQALSRVPRLVGYNLKFDLAIMHQDGYRVPRGQVLSDVIMAARLCNAEQYADLKLASQLARAFGEGAREYDDEFKAYLRKNRWSKAYHLAPALVVGSYCMGDVLGEWRLLEYFEDFIAQTKQTWVWEQEQRVSYVLWCMERVGITFDREYGEVKIPQLQARIDHLYEEIYQLAGGQFNLNSNPQLSGVMKSLKIKPLAKSPKTDQPSWSMDVLLELKHPIAGKIVEMRGLEKMLGTYFEPILEWPGEVAHCQHKNWGAVTGRMSVVDPPLQTIPKGVINLAGNAVDAESVAAVAAFLGTKGRGGFQERLASEEQSDGSVEIGGNIALDRGYEETANSVSMRRMFVGSRGYRLHMLDYSQMEMRIFADYVNDPELTALVDDPTFDFHDFVAMTVWGAVKGHALWEFYRKLAKALNFGLIFGIGVKKLAAQLGKTSAEAWDYRNEYFQRFPRAQNFIDQVADKVKSRGYIYNRFKRRYWIDASRSYIGVNYLVQGTGAEIMKNRMVACQEYLEELELRSRMITQVHDELLFEIHEDEEGWLPWKLQEIMEVPQIKTPLLVEIARGCMSWAQPQKYDRVAQRWEELKVAA